MATRALTAPRARAFPAADVLVVGIAAVVTLALVLPTYARRPFWFDELVSVEIAGLGPRAFADYVFGVESNMALYHAVLALWLQLGSDEAWVRLPSITFAVATLPFVFALGRRLFDRTTAMLAVALMCVNVSFVGYARDARSYALVLLLVTASYYFLVRGAQDGRGRDWAAWAFLERSPSGRTSSPRSCSSCRSDGSSSSATRYRAVMRCGPSRDSLPSSSP